MKCGTCGVAIGKHTGGEVVRNCVRLIHEGTGDGIWIQPEDNGDGTVTVLGRRLQTHSLDPADKDWQS